MPYTDMIDASSVEVVKSFSDAMSWPIGVGITGISLEPGHGVVPFISGLDRWPDFRKAGWDGDLRYTLWAGFKVNGRWVMSGFMQFWKDRRDTGAHPLEIADGGPLAGVGSNWQANWADPRGGWGALDNYRPTAGELMALMVTTGDARMGGDRDTLKMKERSQIVTVPLQLHGSWVFAAEDAPGPTPHLPDPPSPQPQPNHLAETLAELFDLCNDLRALARRPSRRSRCSGAAARCATA
jgi:hypothetical protein